KRLAGAYRHHRYVGRKGSLHLTSNISEETNEVASSVSSFHSFSFCLGIMSIFKKSQMVFCICYLKMAVSSAPRMIQTVVTADSLPMCFTACQENPGNIDKSINIKCTRVVYTASTKMCVVLNSPPDPSYLIVNDPCISQLFSESTIFGANRICPKRSCTDSSPFIVKYPIAFAMVLKNGSFRTYGNSVVWNPSTQLVWIGYLKIYRTTPIKRPTETTDAPTDVIIRCMASKWIACRKSTLVSWMISDAACIQP
uniref:Apple domain-containing protein n=1 Tax=Pristionchus pacificus TaxID=54126 RepID=A0A8R1UXK3_PRIPA